MKRALLALCLCLVERAAAQPGQLYSYTINTAIGDYQVGDGGPATAALLAVPGKIAVDSKGAVYVADTDNHLIRKIVAGQITAVAGTGNPGFSGDGGAATSAQLDYPGGVAVDGAGNVYIYDINNNAIRKVDTGGIIHTIAGAPPSSGSTGDGGPATQAKLNLASGGNVAVDSAGNVYISDTSNSVIRKVTVSTGIISTYAGVIGKYGSTGDGGAATAANLSFPGGLALDAQGNLYIADSSNQTVRMVSAKDGTISTFAGIPGQFGHTGNGGPPAAAKLNFPLDVTVDSQGNVYIADADNDDIREVTAGSAPTINLIAGSTAFGYGGDGGSPTSALFANPQGVAVDSSGIVYISDTFNSRIRDISGGTVGEFAGADHAQGDGGKASNALLYFPQYFAWDAAGNMYIADTLNNRIRKVTTAGIISTIAGTGSYITSGDGGPAISAGVGQPQAVAVDSSGNVYIATGNQIRMVGSDGKISTVVNTSGQGGFIGDGESAAAAELNTPQGLAVDSSGNLYIADASNNRIRKVSGGIISTIAGSGSTTNGSFGGDGGPATSANLNFPADIAFDSAGNLLIADENNDCIRLVNAKTGNIQTIAGTGTKSGYSGDLGPATSALLSFPDGVAVDHAGNIYISDGNNAVVRIVDGLGVISTIAGNSTFGFSGDGGPATAAELNFPYGIGADARGNVWFADTNNQRIRELTPSGPLVPGASSVVNGASFVSGGLVPGGIATVFGSRLTTATGINATSGLPLQTQFMNVSVKINGKINAPLFAVDSVNGAEQINFQVPWELAGQTSAVLQVVDNGVASPTVTVPVLAAQPGIFAILHANYQPVTTANPATDGEVLLIYCTNLGAVSPTVADGAAGTGKELTVATTTVMMGSGSAAVSFSGLASGFVGLYQVNAQVPAGLAAGTKPVVVSAGGVSSSAVMMAVK